MVKRTTMASIDVTTRLKGTAQLQSGTPPMTRVRYNYTRGFGSYHLQIVHYMRSDMMMPAILPTGQPGQASQDQAGIILSLANEWLFSLIPITL